MAVPFASPRARFFDSNGDPLASGVVTFYDAGTSTLKAVYTSSDCSTEATNPHTLDSEGYVRDGGLWLGTGTYKIVLEDADAVTLWTVDDVPGSDSTTTATSLATVDSLADLRNLAGGTFGAVLVLGYSSANDGGGGLFYWSSTNSDADDGGAVIQPSSAPASGRWLRSITDGKVLAPWFGALDSASVNSDAPIANAIAYCTANNMELVFPGGTYRIDTAITFPEGLGVRLMDGAKFNRISGGSGSGDVTFSGATRIDSTQRLGDVYFFPAFASTFSLTEVNAAWWGVDYGSGVDEGTDLAVAVSKVTGQTVVISGACVIASNVGTVSCTLGFSRGGWLYMDAGAGITLTSIDAGRHQIFKGPQLASVGIVGNPGPLFPEWWGAVGDGSTDSRDAFYAMLQAGGTATRGTVDGGGRRFSLGSACAFSASDYAFKDCVFLGAGYLQASGDRLKFTGCSFEGSSYGLRLSGDYCMVSGCYFRPDTYGLEITGVGTAVLASHFYGAGISAVAIYVNADNTYTKVDGCYIANVGTAVDCGTTYGRVTVKGCDILAVTALRCYAEGVQFSENRLTAGLVKIYLDAISRACQVSGNIWESNISIINAITLYPTAAGIGTNTLVIYRNTFNLASGASGIVVDTGSGSFTTAATSHVGTRVAENVGSTGVTIKETEKRGRQAEVFTGSVSGYQSIVLDAGWELFGNPDWNFIASMHDNTGAFDPANYLDVVFAKTVSGERQVLVKEFGSVASGTSFVLAWTASTVGGLSDGGYY